MANGTRARVTDWHFNVSFKCALWHLYCKCKYGTLLALQKCRIALYCHMALFWQIINHVPLWCRISATAYRKSQHNTQPENDVMCCVVFFLGGGSVVLVWSFSTVRKFFVVIDMLCQVWVIRDYND